MITDAAWPTVIQARVRDKQTVRLLVIDSSKRVAPQEVCIFGGQNNDFTTLRVEITQPRQKIIPNRHFTAKSVKL